MLEQKYIQTSNPYGRDVNKENAIRNIYYGEVVSVKDDVEGGRIKVRIPDLDNKTVDDQLPFAYPAIPKFIHMYPQVGEVVRVFIEDVRYPQRGRHWMGSVISQLQKIGRDGYFTAMSTTNMGVSQPDKAPSTIPTSKGVFPDIEDIGLIGRDNTELLLKKKQVLLRVGRHKNDNILQLNRDNPATIQMDINENGTRSSIIQLADKIALISHTGKPKLPAVEIGQEEIDKIFATAHPLGRGDLIVEALEKLRAAIMQHIHGYNGIPADKDLSITALEKIDFTTILQNNIRIN